MSNAHACNHMSTFTIVVFSYHCHDSNTDGNDSHTITTIVQPYCVHVINIYHETPNLTQMIKDSVGS